MASTAKALFMIDEQDRRRVIRCNICGVKAANWLCGSSFPDTLPICSNPVCKNDTLELIKQTLLEAQGGL